MSGRVEAMKAKITTLRLKMECKCERINNLLMQVHSEALQLSCCVLCCDCRLDSYEEEWDDQE